MLSLIHEEYKGAIVVFGKSTLPLGQNPDIDELALIAIKSGNPELKKFFQILPPLDVLLKASVDKKLEAIRPLITKTSNDGAEQEEYKADVTEPEPSANDSGEGSGNVKE